MAELTQFTPEQLTELHALPDDALATAQEAAAFLRLKCGTLAWYRSQGGGPKLNALTPKCFAAAWTNCTIMRKFMGEVRPPHDYRFKSAQMIGNASLT